MFGSILAVGAVVRSLRNMLWLGPCDHHWGWRCGGNHWLGFGLRWGRRGGGASSHNNCHSRQNDFGEEASQKIGMVCELHNDGVGVKRLTSNDWFILTETAEFLHDILQAPAILVTVQDSKGSVPRESGAWMAVFAEKTLGTVGGGRLEWDAIQFARTLLVQVLDSMMPVTQWYRLGARLGQCCGGQVLLQFEYVSAQDQAVLAQRLMVPLVPVALFGAGHVGRALVQVLAPLPFRVHWIDSRDAIFPDACAFNVQTEHSDPVEGAVTDLPAGSLVLIMSFSHAEDFAVLEACLRRQRAQHDLPYIGLIGSKTKWASFQSRLRARGWSDAELAHITSPIGIVGIRDKRPAVMAVSIAAQLLLHRNPA